MMTFETLRQQTDAILLKCISGSNAYGLALPHSDIDLKGVFISPLNEYYGLTYTEQVANPSNDEVYYELGRFFDLLLKNNPNILELLASPADCIQFKHPILKKIKPELFLSRKCSQTFARFAFAQIKKARGLNKKIVNPMGEQRKYVTDFCYVTQGMGSIPLNRFLEQHGWVQENCGLAVVDHFKDTYVLFHQSQLTDNQYFKGVCSGAEANDVLLSSIPKGIPPLCHLNFNKDGYSKYCKDWLAYWSWVENRNEARYQNTIQHEKNYDAKNMMHVFRLLNMAEEIAREHKIRVRRPEREFLLKIRSGAFEYEDLVNQATEQAEKIYELFEKSDLPDAPDEAKAEALLIDIRKKYYSK
jgi:hypothetical protein